MELAFRAGRQATTLLRATGIFGINQLRRELSTSGENDELFKRLASSRKPYFSLPQEYYCEQVHDVDMRQMWSKGWLFAGFSCQLPKTNDYLTYTVGRNSVVITRGADGRVNAFHNVCRHRGSRICRGETGTASTLVCPYHQWTYDTGSGALRHARDMGESFDRAAHGLHPAHVHELNGLLWVSMPPPGTKPHFSFDEAVDTLAPQLRPHCFERAKIAACRTYVINANWKLVYENNRECYHCNKGHPEYIRSNYDTAFSYVQQEGKVVRLPDPSNNRAAEADEQIAAMTAKWSRQLGITCTADSSFPGSGWYRATRNPLRKGWLVESIDGQPVCKRRMGELPDFEMGSMRVHTFPNFWMHASSDHAVATRLTPLSWSQTEAKVYWLVDKDAQPDDYDEEKMLPFWNLTSEQDWILAEDNFLGVMSPSYTPGPLSPIKEESVEKFLKWYINTTRSMMSTQT